MIHSRPQRVLRLHIAAEHYAVIYRDRRDLPAVVATLCLWAEDPRLSFSIADGALLAIRAGVLVTFGDCLDRDLCAGG